MSIEFNKSSNKSSEKKGKNEVPASLLEWVHTVEREKEATNEILSFDEYLAAVNKNPRAECRPSCKYLKDMFDNFGRTDNGLFKVYLTSSTSSGAVYGHQRVFEQIYQNLLNFIEEGFNNKFLLLVGPNGSAKSSIVRKIMEGAEEYSKTREGALYTFSWIFPIDSFIRGTLGFNHQKSSSALGGAGTGAATGAITGAGTGAGAGTGERHGNLETYAYLEDREISSILTSELRDHPLLLIPPIQRQKLIDQWLKEYPNELELVKKSYLYYGDISKRNRMIFDALLQSYQGRYADVLKHIRIERFVISRRYSVAAVTVEPQLHVDLHVQQITMDKRLATLPPGLQSLNLFSVQGENAMANRGILEFSDLLKRPLDAFKYLIMTMESKTINLQGILTELDIFFIGSSNEIHLSAFKQHPDYYSFRGRINFIRVPYLLNAEEEANIYREQVNALRGKTTVEPRSLECLCLWAVMTRLRPSMTKNFKDKKLGDLANTLTPLEKALLYTYEIVPQRLDSEEKKLLKVNISELTREFENENLYEGKFGVSPREIKQIIYELSAKNNVITFVEILDFLTKFIDRKNEYDFLNIAPQGDYANPGRFIELLKDYELEIFDQHLRDSLNLVDDRSYETYIARYIQDITALIKGERLKNSITGRYNDVDLYSVKEFENNIKLKESPEIFRSHMLTTLGAYSLDHPNKKIVYTEVFADIVKILKESFREEQKKAILNIAKNLVIYLSENEEFGLIGPTGPDGPTGSIGAIGPVRNTTFSEENRKEIENLFEKLQGKYRYSKIGALTLVRYLIKERY
ncbi:MAG: hypothetical protein HQK53_03530 [Oligoflexia bacterium]|nr:hypothetical protein [Oligoflexia bacterium]